MFHETPPPPRAVSAVATATPRDILREMTRLFVEWENFAEKQAEMRGLVLQIETDLAVLEALRSTYFVEVHRHRNRLAFVLAGLDRLISEDEKQARCMLEVAHDFSDGLKHTPPDELEWPSQAQSQPLSKLLAELDSQSLSQIAEDLDSQSLSQFPEDLDSEPLFQVSQ